MKLTKEEFIKCFEHCLGAGTCDGCPLVKETFASLGKTSCTRFLLIQLRELFPTFDSSIDIPKIIDEAMEKKDRSVTIFIGAQGTTVNVYPYQETEPHWICKDGGYICSECGSKSDNFPYLHCPTCGEKLKFKEWTDEGKNDEPETTVE